MPKTKQRRSLIKVHPQDVPCTSSDILPGLPVINFDDFRKHIDEGAIMPWTVNRAYEHDCVRIELYDDQHSILSPLYFVILFPNCCVKAITKHL